MTKYDPVAAGARRFPRVISPDEINSMPRLKFAPGIDTSIFSDVAPHWAPPEFMSWPHYPKLWSSIVRRWAAGR
jgi:uncharacterized membrane protein